MAALGDELYTIGLFAGSGQAIDVPDDGPPVIKRLPPVGDFEIESGLKALPISTTS